MESGRGKQAKNRVCPRDEGEEKVGKKVALLSSFGVTLEKKVEEETSRY